MTKVLFIEMTYMFYWSVILCFGLTLFRFKLKPFFLHIVLSTLLLSNVSVILQTTDLIYLLAVIQFLSAFLCVWLIFKIHMKHALLIMSITILIVMCLEWLETALIPQMFIQTITEENMLRFFITGLIQVASICIITIVLRIKRIGFSFIPQSHQHQEFHFTGSNSLKIALFSGTIILFAGTIAYQLFPKGLMVLTFLIFIPIVLLLIVSYKWEVAE